MESEIYKNWNKLGDDIHSKFNEGDCVQLIGSPVMHNLCVIKCGIRETENCFGFVGEDEDDDFCANISAGHFRYLAECAWFDAALKYCTATIPESALEIV